MEVYLVGGAVRDELLGLPVSERDWVVVGASPEIMESQGFKAVGKDFPVFLHPQSKEEYALARTERKQGRGHQGFDFYTAADVTLEEDLLRRDLTINAMAQSESGEIIDLYGGQQDLKKKILRHVSDAFSEDPLRVLRVARFAAKYHSFGFTVHEETLALMRQIVASNELQELSLERIWQETTKALSTDSPGKFFLVLEQTGALAQVFPQIYPQLSIHESSSLGHTVLADIVKKYSDTNIRFASFIGGLHFHAHDNHANIKKFTTGFPLPTTCKKLITLVVSLQHDCHHALQLNAEELLALLHRLDTRRNPERFIVLLDICEAIFTCAQNNTSYEQKKWLQTIAVKIEKINIDTWVREKVSTNELAHNIQQAQLDILKELIKNRN